jgi:hypothetical protein
MYKQNGKIEDAAHIIIKFELYKKFNPIELFMDLIDQNSTLLAKSILENKSYLRKLAVEKLQSPKHMKVATSLVMDYNLNPQDFPYLVELNECSSARYFIMRAFKGVEDSMFMHLYKVEELLEGHPLMLECLIKDLMKKELYQ